MTTSVLLMPEWAVYRIGGTLCKSDCTFCSKAGDWLERFVGFVKSRLLVVWGPAVNRFTNWSKIKLKPCED